MNVLTMVRGIAFGDALGAPFETPDGSIHPDLKNWNGTLRDTSRLGLLAGETTDDTAMSYALAKSIVERGAYCTEHVWRAYLEQYRKNPAIGWGPICKAAFGSSKVEFEPGVDGHSIGSGALMRSAPLAVLHGVKEVEETWHLVKSDAALTHDHEDVFLASYAYVRAVQRRIFNTRGSIWKAVRQDVEKIDKVSSGCRKRILAALSHDLQIVPPSDGSTLSLLASVYWVTQQPGGYMARKGDIPVEFGHAIRLGGDTATRAALVAPLVFAGGDLERTYMQARLVANWETLVLVDAGLTGVQMLTEDRARRT